jgi:uncharacterized coiled-coil protein SlyX
MEKLSDSQKLDLILQSIAVLPKMQADLESMVARVTSLEAKVETQEKTIGYLRCEVRALQNRVNDHEQERRNLSLRLFHFPGSDSETGLAKKVYDKLLKPILKAAHAKGDLPTTPQVDNVIEEIYRAGRFAAGANKPPPPIIIKFVSPAVRKAILMHKRNNTPPPDSGSKRLILTEDLTPDTHKKLKQLMDDERVVKVWSRSGTLWYVPRGDNAKAKIVKSVFLSNDQILG